MKTQFRKLRLLIHLGIIDPSDFYCITVYPSYILLQGTYHSEKLKKYRKGNRLNVNASGYIQLKYRDLDFTFTE